MKQRSKTFKKVLHFNKSLHTRFNEWTTPIRFESRPVDVLMKKWKSTTQTQNQQRKSD